MLIADARSTRMPNVKLNQCKDWRLAHYDDAACGTLWNASLKGNRRERIAGWICVKVILRRDLWPPWYRTPLSDGLAVHHSLPRCRLKEW
jgi:hypothetical protein